MSTAMGLATTRRQLRRQLRRARAQGMRWYLHGLGLRGRLSRAEVLAMRVMLDRYLDDEIFRPDADVTVTPVRERHAGGQVRGEWVEAPGVSGRDDTVLLYVHGGAFVSGSPRTHRGLTAELSARTRRPVFSLDYRLAPEYPFPAAADDVARAWGWLLERGLDPARVVVAGDSAGGHLALGLPPRAVRDGLPVPAGVVAFSPVVDVRFSLGDDTPRPVHEPLVPLAGARALLWPYHAGHHHADLRLTEPDALRAMPPVLLQASSRELLTADVEHYAAALRAAGGQVELRTWPRQVHVFQMAYRVRSAAREALDDVTAFVQRVTA